LNLSTQLTLSADHAMQESTMQGAKKQTDWLMRLAQMASITVGIIILTAFIARHWCFSNRVIATPCVQRGVTRPPQ
jgi:hypothetical protein